MSITTTIDKKRSILPRNTGNLATLSNWVRPSAWLTLPNISTTDNRFVGLFRIDPESNFLALTCTVSGGYTVDWGDNTITNHDSGVAANKQYTYSNIPNTGESSLGHRQVVVTVYPQSSGQNITSFSLQQRHNQSGLNTLSYTAWLDIAINASAMTSLTIGGTTTPLHQLQQSTIFNHSLTDVTSLFTGCTSLRYLSMSNNGTITNMTSMFNNCRSLTTIPLLNTSSVTNMSNMFLGCSSLRSIPLLNTSSVTNMSGMFTSCTSLESIPLLDTSLVTTMTSMFSSCSSLVTIPLLNTSSVTNMATMFSNCQSLKTIPLLNTSSVTAMNNMFSNCFSLQSIPLLDTSSVTIMSSMFSNCPAITTIPLLNTSSVTSMSGMFTSCSSLTNVPPINVSAVSSASNFLNMFLGCSNLSSAPLSGTNQTITYSNCKLSADALNAIYTNLSSNGAGKTIVVTGNWGSAASNTAIATAKGWAVTP